MTNGKRRRDKKRKKNKKIFRIFFGTFLAIFLIEIILNISITAYRTERFNNTKRVAKEGSKESECEISLYPRGGTSDAWVKQSALTKNGVLDLYGAVYDSTINNYSDCPITDWSLRINIKNDCYINSAWNGTVEIHQHIDGSDNVQTLNLLNYKESEIKLDYVIDGQDLLIPLSEGDYVIYHPGENINEKPIAAFNGTAGTTTIGFIFYNAENEMDLSDYEMDYYFEKSITQNLEFKIFIVCSILWLVSSSVFVAILIYSRSAEKKLEDALRKAEESKEATYIATATQHILEKFVLADFENKTYRLLMSGNDKYSKKEGNYEELREKLTDMQATEAEKLEISRITDMENIQKELEEHNGVVTFTSHSLSETGEKWEMFYFISIRKNDHQVRKAVITKSDITDTIMERKKNERALEKAVEEAKVANHAKSQFLSNMSHEIRTPINTILGMNEMIQRESSEDVVLRYSNDIKFAGNMLLGLINDILDFSKIEAGKINIIPEKYELFSLVNDLWSMTRARAKEKNLELKLEVDKNLPSILYGDDLRIRQIIMNILTNAVKYTNEGSVLFTMKQLEKDDDTIFILVSVEDTGIGIKEEEIEKLTKPFERLDEKKNRNIEGTGLGMSITTNLLALMGSRLQVESTYGKGSKFYFSLEQKVVDRTPVGDFDERFKEEYTVKKDKALFHASRARILAVDDTPVNLTVVKELLKRTGIQVDLANSGKECLKMAENQQYNVIFMDYRMPEMDGVETLQKLRQNEGINKNTPVVALTANALSGAEEKYKAEGFDDFLAKPVQGIKLEQMIFKYLPENLLDTEESMYTEIDVEAGIAASGGETIYKKVIVEFSNLAAKGIKELKDFAESEDIVNFTIKAHALKSTARLAGALGLSEEAKQMEAWGNEKNLDKIKENLEKLLIHYRTVADKMNEMLDDKPSEDKPDIDIEEFKELLNAILEYSGAFDFKNVDKVMSEINKYKLPNDAYNGMEQLKNAVFEVDSDEIEKQVKAIQETLS